MGNGLGRKSASVAANFASFFFVNTKFIILKIGYCISFSLPFVNSISEILKVRLGEYDVSTTAEPLRHEEFNISDIVVHPGFNNSTLVHDIALLRLDKPAKRKQVRFIK